jgi:hypothetical protein
MSELRGGPPNPGTRKDRRKKGQHVVKPGPKKGRKGKGRGK